MQDVAGDSAAADRKARVTIALCALCPVLVGLLVTLGTSRGEPEPPPRMAGHWVYVPGLAAAVHVDGETKRVDATVAVGAASVGSPVVQGAQDGYVVDVDRMIVFGPRSGVTGSAPGMGVAEMPVPAVTAAGAFLVYRSAGLVVRLSPERATVAAGGRLGDPVITSDGTVWVHRVDKGEVCALGPAGTALSCPAKTPAGARGGLSMLGTQPVFVDLAGRTVRPVTRDGAGRATPLGMEVPANSRIGPADVGGRVPVLDPTGRRLLLMQPGGDTMAVPLGRGRFDRPMAAGHAVAIVDQDSGRVDSYDSRGVRRGSTIIRTGSIRTTRGEDGRVYADATDGRQSVVMDGDGTLTEVRYGGPAPSYRAPVPPAPTTTVPEPPPPPPTTTAAPTTTPPAATTQPPTQPTTQPPAPQPPAATTQAPATQAPAPTTAPPRPSTTAPGPGQEPVPSTPTGGVPMVDVLSARAAGPGGATVRVQVSGAGPVFCHVYFNSVERAARTCSGTMDIPVTGLSGGMLYDVYVLGTNAQGTGPPGRRAQVRLP